MVEGSLLFFRYIEIFFQKVLTQINNFYLKEHINQLLTQPKNQMTKAKTTHKGFTIEIEYMQGEERCDSDISKTICGTYYTASIGCAEFEGLVDQDGETISCPQSVIDKAYDLEEKILKANGAW